MSLHMTEDQRSVDCIDVFFFFSPVDWHVMKTLKLYISVKNATLKTKMSLYLWYQC